LLSESDRISSPSNFAESSEGDHHVTGALHLSSECHAGRDREAVATAIFKHGPCIGYGVMIVRVC